jgi:hypothetical protein
MKSNIEEAHQAMLEGNRDEVLRLLQGSSETEETLWLRAHAVISDEERAHLLERVADRHGTEASALAGQILEREGQFTEQLNQPPDYQFWKQPTWKERRSKMRLYGLWLLGGLVMITFAILGVVLNVRAQARQELTILQIKSTQTAAAVYNQTAIAYPAGTLQLVQIEYPTTRPVTFGETEGDKLVAASPAEGAQFAAVQLEFVCLLALCDNPPEADLSLSMQDGQIVSYAGSNRPFLIGQPPLARIAQGQAIRAWFVFEVPRNSVPDGILVATGDSETPQFINWVNP